MCIRDRSRTFPAIAVMLKQTHTNTHTHTHTPTHRTRANTRHASTETAKLDREVGDNNG